MIKAYEGISPNVDESCFIAESADVIGKVHIGRKSSIWYNAVLRGDGNEIIVGECTSIQDGTAVHISKKYKTIIGDYVTIGHNAIIHACNIGNNVLIGMGSIILDGAIIEDNVIVGAGTLITSETRIPSGSLVLGSPGKIVRKLTEEEIKELKKSALNYVNYTEKHKL